MQWSKKPSKHTALNCISKSHLAYWQCCPVSQACSRVGWPNCPSGWCVECDILGSCKCVGQVTHQKRHNQPQHFDNVLTIPAQECNWYFFFTLKNTALCFCFTFRFLAARHSDAWVKIQSHTKQKILDIAHAMTKLGYKKSRVSKAMYA